MAFAISQLPNEPVVIVTIALPLDRHLDSFRSTNEQLNQLAAAINESLYIVFDLRGQDLTFSDIMIGLDELGSDPASWIKFPHVVPIGVGAHPVLGIAIKRTWQQLQVQMQTFTTLDDALNFIRAGYDSNSAPGQSDHDS